MVSIGHCAVPDCAMLAWEVTMRCANILCVGFLCACGARRDVPLEDAVEQVR